MEELRERTAADVEAIVGWVPDAGALYRFAGPRLSWPLTAEQLHHCAAAHGTTAWVLEVDQCLTGHAQLTLSGDVARLGRVLVDPGRRGQGHGRVLAAMVIERAERLGAVRIELGVAADNAAARHLYAALGFVPVAGQEASSSIEMVRVF